MKETEFPSKNRYDYHELQLLVSALFEKSGLEQERAQIIAATLLEADLMGHRTHGLALLPAYLKELESGNMTKSGAPEIVRDEGAAITWDGGYLPGPWLVHQAIDVTLEKMQKHPVCTLVIRKSHHIGCLAAYLARATRRGYLILLSCSDPKNKTVAPFGGLDPVYSPNPIAVGIPTFHEPILFDISTSTTANGFVHQKYVEGSPLPHPWLLDRQGKATSDPAAFFEEPPATILPLGGLDAGYKGFALGILVEALTNALGGSGRKDEPNRWSASVFLQIINPEAFGGRDHFKNEMSHLVQSCLESQPIPNGAPVRIPGNNALRLKNEQLEKGVVLSETVFENLRSALERYGLPLPKILFL